jgi:hypothetical protein
MFTWFYEACNFLGSPLAVFQGFGATSNFWRRSKYLTHFSGQKWRSQAQIHQHDQFNLTSIRRFIATNASIC